MKKIVYPFILLSIVGLMVYGMQKDGVQLSLFVNNHLNDLLIVPINLFAVQILWRIFTGKVPFLHFSMVSICVLFYAICFELLLPQFNGRYTADWWDVFCYLAGGALFYMYQHFVISKQDDNI